MKLPLSSSVPTPVRLTGPVESAALLPNVTVVPVMAVPPV